MRVHDDSEFEDKLVVITGGTSGIGLALARALYERKARIVVLARQHAGIDRVLAEFGEPGKQFAAFACDVGSADDVIKVRDAIVAAHGFPDILVNNAGYATYRTFEQEELEEVEHLISVNFTGAVRVTHAFLHGMIKRGTGSIINVASIAGALTLTPNGLYCAAKHGMVAWSKCLAMEMRRFNIHVGVVYPGRVETNFFHHETFQRRSHRRETEFMVPMEVVVSAILGTIVHRRKECFVPAYLGVLAWAANACRPFVHLLLDRLLLARIEDMYRAEKRK
jgi:short-subunit dehydrogenase